MSQVTLFKNTNGNVNIVLKSTKLVSFINSKFFTTDKKLETELLDAAENGEFGVYIDPVESEIDPQYATPMDQLKKKMRDDLLAEIAAGKVAGYAADGGTYTQRNLQESLGNSNNAIVGTEQTQAEQDIADLQKEALNSEGTPAAAPTGALAALMANKTNSPS